MSARKLRALGAPSTVVDLHDDSRFRELILWIEEQKLHHLQSNEEAREEFFQFTNGSWMPLFDQYLASLVCPFSSSERPAVLDWLLRHCVAKDYRDIDCTFRPSHDCDRVMVQRGDSSKGTVVEKGHVAVDASAGLNDTADGFQSNVRLLAELLHVAVHADPKVTVEAVAKVLQKLSRNNLVPVDLLTGNGYGNGTKSSAENAPISLDMIPLGMTAPETELEPALRIIRLLHIANLRELQTRFDSALVALQQITANPQTDIALGKIGSKG